MTQNIQTLREQRADLATKARAMLDDNKDTWTASHNEQYDQLLAQIDEKDAGIKRINDLHDRMAHEDTDARLDDAAERAGHKVGGDKGSEVRKLYTKWLRGGDQAITAAEWADIRATMSTTTGSEGGFSVQSEVASQLIDALKAFGGMREASEIISTAMGNPMSFPTSDGTSEVGELIGENTTATVASPTFGTIAVNTFKFSSRIVAVPFELLQDSEIDIEAFINQRLVTRLGRATNQLFTTGTGTGQPRGIATGATSGKVGATGQTLTVVFDDLVDLVHSVDPAYRVSPGARFMMHDSSLRNIRKLKDTSGRPIFIPGYEGLGGAMGDSLLGYPITVNQDVAVMAANARSILFGDMKKYLIRDAMQANAFRFTDSVYARLGQVGFLYWLRSGGNLLDTAAVKFYANSAT